MQGGRCSIDYKRGGGEGNRRDKALLQLSREKTTTQTKLVDIARSGVARDSNRRARSRFSPDACWTAARCHLTMLTWKGTRVGRGGGGGGGGGLI